jgi:hypothetical protein
MPVIAAAPFQSYDSPHHAPPLLVPVTDDVDTTTAARRVILIHKGEMNLDPDVYLADRLYQAFLMYNYKLALCECLDNEHTLDHVLRHMIHGWCAAMKVTFLRHDDFMNQKVQASLADVVQAAKRWLADYVKTNAVARKIQSGQAQLPSAGLVAAVPGTTPPSLMVSPPNNGKRRYSAAKPKQLIAGGKRKAATTTTTTTTTKKSNKTAAVSVKKPQAKTPRKTSKKLGKQGDAAAATSSPPPPLPTSITDDALPQFNDVDGIDGAPLLLDKGGQDAIVVNGQSSSALLVSPSASMLPAIKGATGEGVGVEPLDKDYALQHLDFSDEAEYLEFFLPRGDGENGAAGPADDDDDDANNAAVFSPFRVVHAAHGEEQDATTPSTMTTTTPLTTAEFHDDDKQQYYADLEVGSSLGEFPDHPRIVAAQEDLETFMDDAMPLLEMTTSEDSSDPSSGDEFLNNMDT